MSSGVARCFQSPIPYALDGIEKSLAE